MFAFNSLAIVLAAVSCQAVVLTPANKRCRSFRDNALLTHGSKCWSYPWKSFTGRFTLKEHHLLRYIVETSGGAMPYASNDLVGEVHDRFLSPVAWGDWTPVTGTAQIGDIVIGPKHLGMIIAVGRLPMVLLKGRQIKDVQHGPEFNEIKQKAANWKVCANQLNNGGTVDPANRPPGCHAYGTGLPVAKIGRTYRYLRILRAPRIGPVRLMRRERHTEPEIPSYQGQEIVFRYTGN